MGDVEGAEGTSKTREKLRFVHCASGLQEVVAEEQTAKTLVWEECRRNRKRTRIARKPPMIAESRTS